MTMEETTTNEATTAQETVVETTSAEEATPMTYTQEEVDKLVQSISDQRVTQALKKAERKAEAKVKEAEKLASMNQQQKYEYELNQREQAIIEKEKELALAENKAVAASVLADKGLSAKLVDFVVAEDADDMNNNISLLEQEFKLSVKKEVERRLATATPKKNLPTNEVMTKESFNKLSLTEQANLYQTNPELYKMMTQ